MTISLPAIVTAARAGSLDQAWRMFVAAGYDGPNASAGALAVKGRLLKDRALRLAPSQRPAAFAEAAAAYAAADALAPQPYTKINVATLTLLCGDRAEASRLAGELLAWLDGQPDIAETPYYLAATRAEAHLLRGDTTLARAAMEAALAHDPDGWSDHASTLRQLALILNAQAVSVDWLDRFRPPRSLYYAGHLGIADDDSTSLAFVVADVLTRERVGFGFGALAAGSDIVIAEALLAQGAELHVVLPTGIDAFIGQSVTPFGHAWLRRFRACIAAASSVRTMTRVRGAYEPLATQLAGDVAMGSAILNARQLESEAVQLLIADEGAGDFGTGLGTARDGARWQTSGRRQHLIAWPRTAPVPASGARQCPEGRPDRRLAAMLHISFDGLDAADEGTFADLVDSVLTPFRQALATLPVTPDLVLPSGNARLVAFTTPQAAWDYARMLLALPASTLPVRIAGHYALAHWLDDPPALVGPGVAELDAVAASVIPGVLTVSETFASALFVGPDDGRRAELVGEVGAMRLFAIAQ